MGKIIFLRHAETEKDPGVNAAQWGLSEEGKRQALGIVDSELMRDIDAIYVSSEPKTMETVRYLAERLSIVPVVDSSFDEVKRGDAFFAKTEFEEEKRRQLADFAYKAFGGESCDEALARFAAGIRAAERDHSGKTVLIVTHGTVLNAYFAELLHAREQIADRWTSTAFCAVGVVEDGVVTKDII
jgi:broad specificity phosphatase PhoE